MAKGILEFDLNEPDDVIAHKRAVKATDMAIALHEISYNLKKRIGYELEGADIKGEEVSNYEVLNMVFDRIHAKLNELNIDIDEILN